MSPLGPSREALETKARFIEAYFEDFAERVAFARSLHSDGRRDEALVLICAYIAGIGDSIYWERDTTRRNFVAALLEHGGTPYLNLVHGPFLLRGLSGVASVSSSVRESLAPHLEKEPTELVSYSQVVELARENMSAADLQVLERHIWLGTLASIAYQQLRYPFAHSGRGPQAIYFSRTTHQGRPAPEVDFDLLASALENIIEHFRNVSQSSNAWFGHDYKSGAA